MKHEVDKDALIEETLRVIRSHGLHPQTLDLILNVPREEFDALAHQYPAQHYSAQRSDLIVLKKGTEWFIQIQPVWEPGDYPDGSMLRPAS